MRPRLTVLLSAWLGLALLFAAGLAMRRWVLAAQYREYGRPLPFQLESALEFRYVRLLAEGGRLPIVDRKVQTPGGVVVRETYTIGAEPVYAALAAWLPRRLPLDERVRWVAAAWFCLGIPALSFWLWVWLRSAVAAGVAGAAYAVSVAAVMRSTGQELQHENFALPLLAAHWSCAALARRAASRRGFLAAGAAAAALLAAAAMTWDLMQWAVLIWAIVAAVRLGTGGLAAPGGARERGLVLLTAGALALAGALNPYLRAHAFLASYPMLLAYGVVLGIGLDRLADRRAPAAGGDAGGWRRAARWALPLLTLAAGGIWLRGYGAHYGHFLELLAAKLRFVNHKPADPALLTFAQRILWTPPLNSSTPLLTWMLFPASLPLSLLAGAIALVHRRRRPDPELDLLLPFAALSFLAFVLFMRFHVFLSLGVAALLGWLAAWACARRSLGRWLALVLLLAGLGVEAAQTARHPLRWGSAPGYLREKQELAAWMRTYGGGAPVLANFGISAFLLAYADCPIVLHPKFESPDIRARAAAYGNALFRQPEARFRDWAEAAGAAFYVHALGEFADRHPESQMRYFVDALNPPPAAAARLFEFRPGDGRWFQWLWGNAKYRVFRVITRGDERRADAAADAAAQALRDGRPADAARAAERALMYMPRHAGALEVLLAAGEKRPDFEGPALEAP